MHFANEIKAVLIGAVGCSTKTPSYLPLFYRCMTAAKFIRFIVRDYKDIQKLQRILYAMITKEKNKRYFRLAFEFHVALANNIETALESNHGLIHALKDQLVERDYDLVCLRLLHQAKLDLKMFEMIRIYLTISELDINRARNISKTLAWYEKLMREDSEEEVLVNNEELSLTELLLAQKLYEEERWRTSSFWDMSTYTSFWCTVLNDRNVIPANQRSAQQKTYRCSRLVLEKPPPKQGIVLKGKYNPKIDTCLMREDVSRVVFYLVLHDGKNCIPHAEDYAALLQLLYEYTGKLYKDVNRLDHIVRLPDQLEFCDVILDSKYTKLKKEYELLNLATRVKRERGIREASEQPIESRNSKLPSITREDFEVCSQSAQNFVRDYLLWAYVRSQSWPE